MLSWPAQIVGDDEYVEESFRCPGCHSRSTELLPLTGGWWWVRMTFIVVLVALLTAAAIPLVLPQAWSTKVIVSWMGDIGMLAVLLAGVLGVLLIFTRRRIRCRECASEWTKSD